MPYRPEQIEPVADAYAEALLAAAAEQGREEEVARAFSELIQIIDREIDFCRMLVADSVDDEPRRASLERILRGRVDDLLVNLLQVMNNRGRLRLVRDVYRCVELRMEARHHEQEVVVETALPLTDDLKDAIREQMRARTGREIILIEQVRPELIGGIVIHHGDIQIDASVISRIGQVRKRLRERATEEIHGKRGYVIEA